MERAVKYKYGLHPLSTVGSLTYIGGRFNTGSRVNTEVLFFSSLYLAQDKDTALQEHLRQETLPGNAQLTPREVALTNPSSETIVSVSGKLDKVFDLTNADNLIPFVNLIKRFKLSPTLILLAKKLKVDTPGIVKTASQLSGTLLCHNWRSLPLLIMMYLPICLKYTSRRDRFIAKLKSMKQFLEKNLTAKDTLINL